MLPPHSSYSTSPRSFSHSSSACLFLLFRSFLYSKIIIYTPLSISLKTFNSHTLDNQSVVLLVVSGATLQYKFRPSQNFYCGLTIQIHEHHEFPLLFDNRNSETPDQQIALLFFHIPCLRPSQIL